MKVKEITWRRGPFGFTYGYVGTRRVASVGPSTSKKYKDYTVQFDPTGERHQADNPEQARQWATEKLQSYVDSFRDGPKVEDYTPVPDSAELAKDLLALKKLTEENGLDFVLELRGAVVSQVEYIRSKLAEQE